MGLFNFIKNRYEGTHKYITSKDIQSLHMFYILFWLTLLPLFMIHMEGAKMVGIVLIILSPLWLTGALVAGIWNLWIDYIQLKFLSDEKQDAQLYEIILPKDITKSPAAMELFFEGLLLSQGETTGFDVWWKGRVRPWFSLEIAGIEGQVKMYLWCWKRYTTHVEAQLYAQYPDVQLKPIDDYAAGIEYDTNKQFAWGMRYKLKEPEVFPIKTYIEFGLDINPDRPETKIDPMVNVLEKFALVQKGEQMWLQILFQKSNRKVNIEADDFIQKMYDDNASEFPMPGDDGKVWKGAPTLTPAQKKIVDILERSAKKPSFDCIIRGMYLADNDSVNTLRIQSIVKMFGNYAGHNSFVPDGSGPGGDYPWQDYTLPDPGKVMKKFITAYRLRGGFHAPFKRASITLTTEELATLYHFPSSESAVPGLQKTSARSVGAPTNLPT